MGKGIVRRPGGDDLEALMDAAIALREGDPRAASHRMTVAACAVSVVGHRGINEALLDARMARLPAAGDGWQMVSAVAHEAKRRMQLLDAINLQVVDTGDIRGLRVSVMVKAGPASVEGGVLLQDVARDRIVHAEAVRMLTALAAQFAQIGEV